MGGDRIGVPVITAFGWVIGLCYFTIVQIVTRWDFFIDHVGGAEEMWKPLTVLSLTYALVLWRWGVKTIK